MTAPTAARPLVRPGWRGWACFAHGQDETEAKLHAAMNMRTWALEMQRVAEEELRELGLMLP